MKRQLLIGIDLGGTTIKMAFVESDGDIAEKWEIPTDTSEKGKNISNDIATSIRKKANESNIPIESFIGIGMGAPGFIDLDEGYIYNAVNLGWENYPLKEDLENQIGLPVFIENDANIAALGEMWKGAGNHSDDLICVTLGTGIGGGIISNGSILHGTNGMAGEIGHITAIHEGGAPCNCGKTGCIETIASATGIARIAMEGLENHPNSKLKKRFDAGNSLTAKDVFECAADNDSWAIDIVKSVTHHLGLTIANLANALNPSKIVIGGGVSRAGDQLLDPLNVVFNQYALPRVSDGAELVIASLGNDAGVIGGAWLVKSNLS
ncbi:ROK family glucokinase [Alkalihalobacillus sp. AL-G]|uniref:ROK family glucokinase n=1 Tax=Alkalihalobacillus sp. AL-G TaxID=2926399 RepID=UPI00272BBC24|nr:ROK family glucokinase [Alkalihalobacillus sp. AL-G]WLD92062.1 ROK family glucokinase [Alkalihalobacillus sp. AL-G]